MKLLHQLLKHRAVFVIDGRIVPVKTASKRNGWNKDATATSKQGLLAFEKEVSR